VKALPTIRSPNFLIVGVTKGGTTFLAKALSEHPDVFYSRPKELFFFNTRRVTKASYETYLHNFFAAASDQRWVGEGSTNYFHHEYAIKYIERYLGPETHIIVCLRHPVERLFSHYLHNYKRERVSGAETLDDEIFEHYISRSSYAKRLKIWKSRFANFRVLFFDDLVTSAPVFYSQAATFLDLTPQQIEDRPINEGLRLAWDQDFLVLRSPVAPGRQSPRFRRDHVERLSRRFAPDIERTMALSGRDLSSWLALPNFELVEQKFEAWRTRSEEAGHERVSSESTSR
jgi:hypothetical protein